MSFEVFLKIGFFVDNPLSFQALAQVCRNASRACRHLKTLKQYHFQYLYAAYDEYDWKLINRIWVTLQTIYDQIIINHGSNKYKIVHMNKEKLERENRLPVAMRLSQKQETIFDGMFLLLLNPYNI